MRIMLATLHGISMADPSSELGTMEIGCRSFTFILGIGADCSSLCNELGMAWIVVLEDDLAVLVASLMFLRSCSKALIGTSRAGKGR